MVLMNQVKIDIELVIHKLKKLEKNLDVLNKKERKEYKKLVKNGASAKRDGDLEDALRLFRMAANVLQPGTYSPQDLEIESKKRKNRVPKLYMPRI